MKVWKNKLVPILFAIASVGFFVPVVKQVIKEEPVNGAFLVLALAFFVMAIVFLAVGVGVGRKSGGGSGTPSA